MEWSCPCRPLCWGPNETRPIGPAWLLTHKMGMGFTQHHESLLPVSETNLIWHLTLFDFVLFLHSSTFNWTNSKLKVLFIPMHPPHSFSAAFNNLLGPLTCGWFDDQASSNHILSTNSGRLARKSRLTTNLDMGTFVFFVFFLLSFLFCF